MKKSICFIVMILFCITSYCMEEQNPPLVYHFEFTQEEKNYFSALYQSLTIGTNESTEPVEKRKRIQCEEECIQARNKHPNTRPIKKRKCSLCGKQYSKMKGKNHKNWHSILVAYKCDICETGYGSKESLKTHNGKYHQEKKRVHKKDFNVANF